MLANDRRLGRISSCVALILLAMAAPGVARTQPAPPLPPAAQAALDRGVTAAKVQDYPGALALLEDARKAAPDAPIIYLNLGLAESKIAGRELRAIAWLAAYLAANPDAPNAAAVKAEITALKIGRRANTSRLFTMAETAAGMIPKADRRDFAWTRIALDRAFTGDIVSAQKAARLVTVSLAKTDAATSIADAQISARDMAGARRTLEAAVKSAGRIDHEPQYGIYEPLTAKEENYKYIVRQQAAAGYLSDAFRTASLITYPARKVQAQIYIGEAQAKAGDAVGARKTFASARNTADLMPQARDEASWKARAQIAIAEAQVGSGDCEGAKISLLAAQRTVSLIQGADLRDVKELSATILKNTTCVGQVPVNSKAHEDQSCLPSPSTSRVKTSEWIAILTDSNARNTCPLNTSPFLNLSAHLNALPPNPDAWVMFNSLEEVLATLLKAEKAVDGMLARELGL